ncbi:Phage integrase [Brachybacterium faecium]|nr:Phage integrase [Brachybacterium faecium]
MKLVKSKKNKYIFWYLNTTKEKIWCVRFMYHNSFNERKEFSKRGIKTEKEAYQLLLKVQNEIEDNDYSSVRMKNIKIGEWADNWFDNNNMNWKSSTKDHVRLVIKNHIKPKIGYNNLGQLSRLEYIKKFINPLSRKMSPATVRTIHTIMMQIVNSAVEHEVIKRNKFVGIAIKKSFKKNKSLSADELQIFLKESENFSVVYSLAAHTLAFSGMRKGELAALTWKDINFVENTLSISKTRDLYGVRTPKSQNSYRTIYMNDDIMTKFNEYKNLCRQTKFSKGLKLKESDFIFIQENTAIEININTLNKWFKIISEVAHIEHVHPHMLRHTHATLLLEQQVPIHVVAERLGNTPQIVANVYAHVLSEARKSVVEVFQSALKKS